MKYLWNYNILPSLTSVYFKEKHNLYYDSSSMMRLKLWEELSPKEFYGI